VPCLTGSHLPTRVARYVSDSVSLRGRARVISSDRWDFGEQYLTVVFALDESSTKQVACGLSWAL